MKSENRIPRQAERYVFSGGPEIRLLFLLGPRGAGKTTLAKEWLRKCASRPLYFDWDDARTRLSFLEDRLFFDSYARLLGLNAGWVVFDEIQKREEWIGKLQEAHRQSHGRFRFLIPASTDFRMQAGVDALAGTGSLHFHLLPLSLREVAGIQESTCFLGEPHPEKAARCFEEMLSAFSPSPSLGESCRSLLRFGSFPGPFSRQSEQYASEWHREYFGVAMGEELKGVSRLVRSDKVEHLFLLMRSRVSSPLSEAGLAAELGVAHTTVKVWLERLKQAFLLFPVFPWSRGISRALKKGKKWYFYDWIFSEEREKRINGMVAAHLHRTCLMLNEFCLGHYGLYYVQTLDRKGMDFLVVRDGRPYLAVEVDGHGGGGGASRALRDRAWLGDSPPKVGVRVTPKSGACERDSSGAWVLGLDRFLSLLF